MVKSAHRGRGALLSLVLALVGLAAFSRADAGTQAYYYDAAGRLTGVVDPVNGTAIYSLDGAGNVLSVTEKPIGTMIVGGFVPAIGPAGTSVTIGGNFAAATTSNTTVKFNSVTANVTAVSATQLTVTVPSGATTGPVSVTVSASSGGNSYTTALNFTVQANAAPTITSVSSGSQSSLPILVEPVTSSGAATSLTITGTHFSTTNSQVYINNFACLITAATSTHLTVSLPLGVTTGHVTVETPAGTATTSGYVFIPPYQAPGRDQGWYSQNYPLSAISAYQAGSLGTNTTFTMPQGQLGLLAVDVTAGQSIGAAITAQSNGSQSFTTGQFGTSVSVYMPNGLPVNTSTDQDDIYTLSEPDTFGGLISPSLYTPASVAGTALVVVAQGSLTSETVLPLAASAPVVTSVGYPGSSGATATVSLATAGQAGNVRFGGTAGYHASVYVPVPSSNNACLWVHVVAPDGITNVAQSDLCGGTAWLPDFVLPQSGSYVISVDYISDYPPYPYPSTLIANSSGAIVSPLTGQVSPEQIAVSVWTYPGDIAVTTGYANSSGFTPPGPITFVSPGQYAQYTFPVAANDNVTYVTQQNSSNTSLCYYANLLDQNGGINSGHISGCGSSPVMYPGPLPAGNWSIVVVPYQPGLTGDGVPDGGSNTTSTWPATFDLRVYKLSANNAICPGQTAPSTTPCPLTVNAAASSYPITVAGQQVVAQFTTTAIENATLKVTGTNGLVCYSVQTSSSASVPPSFSPNANPCSTSYSSGSVSLPAGTYTVTLKSALWSGGATSDFGLGTFTLQVTTP